ncbi:MAG: hypothetical protein NC402_07330 [Prevotella sp.]|nr:hypothetical protein [Prevotella sp.]MCM1075549.1 hypothetical protein [Ruminococcus sp.]
MKRFYFAAVPLSALALCSLPSCMDDKYDLSDVDTTVEVKVTDLTVPVNIDPIKLESIFDIKEGDRIKVVDGYYAVVEDGEFNTDDITISRIELAAPYIESQTKVITGIANAAKRAAAQDLSFPLSTPEASFEYHTSDVSDFIVSIESAGTQFTFDINMSFSELNNIVSGGTISDLKLQIPAGLTLVNPEGSYDANTGVYALSSVSMTGNKINLRINANNLNAKQAGINYNHATHTLDFDGHVSILDGTLHIKAADIKGNATMPSTITLRSDYAMSDIKVTSFTGSLDYKIDNSSFSDIDLSELPDFLSQPGTDIKISNPQIYLDINNPLYMYSLYAETDMRISSTGQDGTVRNYQMDKPFRVNGIPTQPDLSYCLSPSKPAKWYPGYTNPTHETFTSLSDILSGNGIPKKLSVELVNPTIPVQHVKDLKLGENLGKIHGHYTFFAPLSLKAGSSVVYSDREDGWSSEDLDAVTIKALEVNVNVTTNIPLKVNLTGYPINKEGNRINNVDILGGEVNANADNQAVRLYITGEIKDLDGIEFVATAISTDPNVILNPDMTITLTNLKAKVSGVYNKEL